MESLSPQSSPSQRLLKLPAAALLPNRIQSTVMLLQQAPDALQGPRGSTGSVAHIFQEVELR